MPPTDAATLALLDDCSRAALALLQDNLTEHGILAASRSDAAVARRYTRIFGRDAAICVLAPGAEAPDGVGAVLDVSDPLRARLRTREGVREVCV